MTAVGAVSRDIATMGQGMAGNATPEQITAARMRSYVGPTAGAGLAMRQTPNVLRSGAARAVSVHYLEVSKTLNA